MAVKHYLVASDFDQTLSFNDSGQIVSDLLGVSNFRGKVAGLAASNLVQQGGELAYLIRHDPEYRGVRREHLAEAGRHVRLRSDIPALIEFFNRGLDGFQFSFFVISAAPQEVMRIDEVCYRFPELTIVTRHGCEPWTDLAVKLMLKWPNLYYSTSAFAPKYYPKDIVDYANTRGADKIIYAGYFPMGLSLERIMTELPNVTFKDDVWPKFLRENALKVLGLSA